MNTQKKGRRVPHRAPMTQRMSYKQAKEAGFFKKQEDYIVELLASSEPLTAKVISRKSGISPSSTTRAITGLKDNERIRVHSTRRCPESGITVEYYEAIKSAA